jgi:hypothetical protein
MNSDEYVVFLTSVLIKIENAINLLEHKPAKHIPAYHKMLGVQQKLAGLDCDYRSKLFSQLIVTRGIISYLTNGQYENALVQIMNLKGDLINICLEIKNEKDTVKKV